MRWFIQRVEPVRVGLRLVICFGLVEAAAAQENPLSLQPGGMYATGGSAPVPLGAAPFEPVPGGVAAGPHPAGTSQLGGALLPASFASVGQGLWQWGEMHLRPHVDYQLSYGNNLQPVPGQQVNTLVNQLSPGVLIQLGPHWTLDYTPTLRFYSDPHFQDGTDHAVSLSGQTTYEAWRLGLSQSYATTSQPLIETAAQTSQETYGTALSAGRPLGSKCSLDLSLNQNFLFVDTAIPNEALTDRRSWSTLDWLNYQLWPQLSVGVGLGLSYDDMAVGSDVLTEQYQGRVTWQPGEKLSLVFTGGLSDLQFFGSGSSGDLLSPIFSLAAQYHLFEPTTLSLGASRGVSPSYFQNQVSESTGVNAGVSQRLFGRFYLNVGGGYGDSTYHASASGSAVASVSDYQTASFNVSLSTSFLKRAAASVFFSQNYILSSTSAAFNYTTTQTGLELSYRY